jgi:PAS domain S-box-containing protein
MIRSMSAAPPPSRDPARDAEKARLLLAAAKYLNETLDPDRVHDRFRELLADAVPHGGVVVSSYDEASELIRCDYAWVDGNRLDPEILPPLSLNREGGGMQSRVIVTGESLLVNDVAEQVKDPKGVYFDVDREGQIRRVPEQGPPGVQAAMMIPVKHEGRVVGVVQLMNDRAPYLPEQLELAEGLVGLMAASARNARLYETAQAEAAARARAEATAAAREQAARVLEAVGDGIFHLDRDGVIRFWNRAAELVTGIPGERARGRAAPEVLAGWESIVAEIPVAGDEAPPRPVTLPIEIGGTELWLSFVAVRAANGVVFAFRDLTTERRLEEAKSDFIATISHELRTPMTAVIGAATTLMRRDVTLSEDRRRQLLEMIETEAARLGQITESVLLAGRLDRDDIRVERERVDVRAVIGAAVEAMGQRLPPQVTLKTRVETNGVAVLGDRDRFEQVLLNLIDNAIKYSPAGGDVVVSTERVRDVVRVAVKDEGIGIPAPEQSAIFEKFYRADPELRLAPSGTGLGLYISRELVERMGGKIGVESRPGSGSTFFVELPAA